MTIGCGAWAGVIIAVCLAACSAPATREALPPGCVFDDATRLAVALCATYLPARRAAGVDPVVALRAE